MFNRLKQKFNSQLLLKNFLSFSLLLLFTFFIVNFAKAVGPIIDSSANPTGDYKLNDFINLAITVAKIIWAVSGSLALGAFVYGGFMMLISGGNPQRVTKGKEIITGAVIGLAIVFGSYAIIYFIINRVLGITEVTDPFNTQQWASYLGK
jgi:hypothetical protein